MNVLEGTIFVCGVGILALSGCTQVPEPIEDASIYVGGKVGTITVNTPEWDNLPWLDCMDTVYRTHGRYIEGHEDMCLKDGGTGPKPDPKPDPKPTLGNPGNDKPVGRSGEKPEKDMDERSPEGSRGKSN